MKVSKDFSIHEFVPAIIYERYVDRAVRFIDPRLVQLAQFIRDRFMAEITINNYMAGGNYQYSGFRDHACTIGALNSQHRAGRAMDFRVKGLVREEVRQDFIRHFPLYQEADLTTIEAETPPWVHADCRFTNQDTLLIVPYK